MTAWRSYHGESEANRAILARCFSSKIHPKHYVRKTSNARPSVFAFGKQRQPLVPTPCRRECAASVRGCSFTRCFRYFTVKGGLHIFDNTANELWGHSEWSCEFESNIYMDARLQSWALGALVRGFAQRNGILPLVVPIP